MFEADQVSAKPGEAQWLDAKLCFNADEASYCKPDTKQYAIMSAANEADYSTAYVAALDLCAERNDGVACRMNAMLRTCANGGDAVKQNCRRLFE